MKCKSECLNVPQKVANFKFLTDEGFSIEDYPTALQAGTCLNFFFIKYVNSLVSFLEEELSKIDSISYNCYGKCGSNRIAEYDQDAYCKFCSYRSKILPCPKEWKISYDVIKASEDDMEH